MGEKENKRVSRSQHVQGILVIIPSSGPAKFYATSVSLSSRVLCLSFAAVFISELSCVPTSCVCHEK